MSLFTLFLLHWISITFGYDMVRDYSGNTFFQGWDFYGSWDNLTLGRYVSSEYEVTTQRNVLGDVWWLNQQDAFSQGLAALNNAGNVILKVDNTSNVEYLQKRNSVCLLAANIEISLLKLR